MKQAGETKVLQQEDCKARIVVCFAGASPDHRDSDRQGVNKTRRMRLSEGDKRASNPDRLDPIWQDGILGQTGRCDSIDWSRGLQISAGDIDGIDPQVQDGM